MSMTPVLADIDQTPSIFGEWLDRASPAHLPLFDDLDIHTQGRENRIT